MKFLLLGSQADYLVRFRKDLVADLLAGGHQVVLGAPPAGSEVLESVRKMGAEFRSIPMSRTGLNPFRELVSFWALCRLMRRLRPDVVLCFAIKPVLYGSLAARVTGTSHCFSMITGAGWLFMGDSLRHLPVRFVALPLYRAALDFNRVVFFQNPDDLELFARQGLLQDRGKAQLTAGSGVHLGEYPCTPVPSGTPRFLFVGRLLKDKGVREFVEAAGRLKALHPEARFEILGPLDRNPTAIKEKELELWRKEGVVDYLGETLDVRPFLQRCSVFVLPSYREGTPRSSLEALSTGRAIVTTDAPGCRETVREGENGFMVPVQNAQALADAMERFIRDPALIHRMGQVSRALAEVKFDVRHVNRTMLNALGL